MPDLTIYPWFTRWLANCNRLPRYILDRPSHWLNASFTWQDSPEGSDFWDDIHECNSTPKYTCSPAELQAYIDSFHPIYPELFI